MTLTTVQPPTDLHNMEPHFPNLIPKIHIHSTESRRRGNTRDFSNSQGACFQQRTMDSLEDLMAKREGG